MRSLGFAAVIAFSVLLLQAEDFTLKHFALGPVITLHTTLSHEGKGARLIATAKNESGAPIRHAKICILSAADRKGCLFELWNTNEWTPGAELTWNVTTSVKVTALSHQASLLEFDGGNVTEQPAQAAAALPPVPVPPPAPIQSPVPMPAGSAIEKPSQPTTDMPAPEMLTNETVIKLAKAGLSDDVIVALVNTRPGQYVATPTAVIALKQAGVADRVILAIVNKNSGSAPIAPGTQILRAPQQPVQYSTLPNTSNKPRVLLQSASKGPNRNAARDQSMEMSKDFERDCPGVMVTVNPQMADYTVLLNHIEVGLLVRDNQIQVANKDGDLLAETKEGGSIAGDVKKACALILADWAKR